ncbi:hypothetical protein L6452_34169 [Arctium lappa]|uniref:Uncharacterized protein n=1 Tax=Arctium lappa TaxID=4217 RepID=A0ACB8YLN7_ARCLA|nr:hypothetical protein L6452_34169 [Arctium lappa]
MNTNISFRTFEKLAQFLELLWSKIIAKIIYLESAPRTAGCTTVTTAVCTTVTIAGLFDFNPQSETLLKMEFNFWDWMSNGFVYVV